MSAKKDVVFLTKHLMVYAYYSLFMTTVGNGIVSLFNFNDSFKTIYYSIYTLSNLIFVILLLIRIPYYRREKKKIN